MDSRFRLRDYVDADAVELTALLHAAYGEHLRAGLNFTAADQNVETTRHRSRGGGCWVLEDESTRIVATMTMSWPPSRGLQRLSATAREPHTAWLNQLAVHPDMRGTGCAGFLFRHGLGWSSDQGAIQVGIDTAAPAERLVALYRHWGFEHRDTVHWEGKTYDSVVMVRPMSEPGVARQHPAW